MDECYCDDDDDDDDDDGIIGYLLFLNIKRGEGGCKVEGSFTWMTRGEKKKKRKRRLWAGLGRD